MKDKKKIFFSLLGKLESRLGLYLTAIFIGIILICFAYHSVGGHTYLGGHGFLYKKLSLDPFNFSDQNPNQYRILTPLLAHFLLLRGNHYFWMPIIIIVLFLASLYIYYRKQNYSEIESLGMSALMAFSTTILFTMHAPGFTDTTSYLLLFLCLIFIRYKKPLIWGASFSLALLNHESNIFALPWLLFLAYQNPSSRDKKYTPILVTVIAILPLLLFRYYVSNQVEVEYSSNYYTNVSNIINTLKSCALYSPLAIFYAFRLFWYFPLIALITLFKRKQYQEAIFLVLIVFSSCGQLLFATDTSRLIGLAFPAILVGAEYTRTLWGSHVFIKRLWLIIGLNFLIPYSYVARNTIRIFFPGGTNIYFK